MNWWFVETVPVLVLWTDVFVSEQYAKVLGFNPYSVYLYNLIGIAKQLPLCLLEFGGSLTIKYSLLDRRNRLKDPSHFITTVSVKWACSQFLPFVPVSQLQQAVCFLLCFMFLFHTHVMLVLPGEWVGLSFIAWLKTLFKFFVECLLNCVCSRAIL